MKHYIIRNISELKELLARFKDLPDVLLGTLLLKSHLIDQNTLEEALNIQQKKHEKRLGQILLAMGAVTPMQLNMALAQKLGIPFARIKDYLLPHDALSQLPADIAKKNNILPLGVIDGSLIVAMESPFDVAALNALKLNYQAPMEMVMAPGDEIAAALGGQASSFDASAALDDLDLDVLNEGKKGQSHSQSARRAEVEAQKKPIVRLLNAIILQAIELAASDIHIRPDINDVKVFYRVDGVLQFSQSLSKSLLPVVVSRLKIIGEMDISERRMPQGGHACISHGNRLIDLRISIVPTVKGESSVIRILDQKTGQVVLEDLGFEQDDLACIREAILNLQGMILVTGPTGSGKTTSMYSLVHEIKKRNAHILTVEDPVEYEIEGVEQVQVSTIKGYTFASALRHFLRHDPDVILVGEIRDEETAKIANKAALTGHLVLSTLHTNDAISTVIRLLDMGIESYLVGSTLLLVVAQRLVRLNCEYCLIEDPVSSEVRQKLVLNQSDVFYKSKGCYRCNYTGFKGRKIVAEILRITPDFAEKIMAGSQNAELLECALKNGMVPMKDNALALARRRETSLGEVVALGVGY